MSNVIALHDRGWMTAAELAKAEGVSTRTIYRRLERGEVEAKETEAGKLYRVTPTDSTTDTADVTDSHDTATDTADSAPLPEQRRPVATTDTADTDTDRGRHDTATVTAVTALVERLEASAVERGRLEAELDRLAAELTEWQTFAVAAVEEVERLRGD